MLMMRVGSFGHMEQIPAQTETDKYNLVEFVFSKLAKFVAVLPALEQPWKVEISTVSEDLLEIVNVIRTADLIVHEKIWERCIANPIHMYVITFFLHFISLYLPKFPSYFLLFQRRRLYLPEFRTVFTATKIVLVQQRKQRDESRNDNFESLLAAQT